MTTTSDPPADSSDWTDLCEEYENWFGSFLAGLQALTPAQRQEWETDPSLGEILALVDQARGHGVVFDPRRIAGDELQGLPSLGKRPPTDAHSRAQASEALTVVRQVGRLLDAWPAVQRVAEAADAMAGRGWRGRSRHVRSVMTEAGPQGGAAVASISQLLATAQLLGSIESSWSGLADRRKVVSDAGDPTLAGFWEAVEKSTRPRLAADPDRDLQVLAQSIEQLDATAAQIVKVLEGPWGDQIDREALAQDMQTPGDAVTIEHLQQWLAAVPQHVMLPADADPRRAVVEELARVRDRAAKLAEDAPGSSFPEDLGRSLRTAEEAVAGLQSHAATVGNRDLLARDSEEALGSVRNVTRRLDAYEERMGTKRAQLVRSLSTQDSISQQGSEAIDLEWRERRDKLAATAHDAASLAEGTDHLKALLRRLEDAWPRPPFAGVPDGQLRDALLAVVTRERNLTFQRAVRNAGPDLASPEFRAKWELEAAGFAKWCGLLSDVAAECIEAGRLLDDAYGLTETGPEGATVGDLLNRAEGAEVMADPDMRAVFGPVLERGRQLLAVDGIELEMGNREALVSLAVEDDAAVAIAAWRRLLRLPVQGGQGALLGEARVLEHLTQVLAHVPDSERRRTLLADVTTQGQKRWLQHLAASTELGDLEAALGLGGAFSVTPEDLPAWARYDVALHGLCSAVAMREAADSALAAQLQALRERAGQLPPQGQDAPLGAFIARLQQVDVERPVQAHGVGEAGPGRVGWAAQEGPDAQWVRYTRELTVGSSAELTFVRVVPNGPTPRPFYLGTTEVPVSLLLSIARTDLDGDDAARLLGPMDDRDPRLGGPRTWTWRGGRIARSPEWLPHLSLEWADAWYASPRTRPTLHHPAQYVSPAGAVWLASRLGCRLPTAAEWQAARLSDEGSLDGPPNLRDRTWLTQLSHVDQLLQADASLRRAAAIWPDAGAFQPSRLGPGTGRDARAAADHDDGALWFAKVGPAADARFSHLVGNVAEFVWDAAEGGTLPGEDKLLSTQEVTELLASASPTVAVIGGSAVSAPEIDPTHAYPVGAQSVPTGFCDVGLRLAFSAPGQPLGERLAEVLRDRRYATGH